MNKQQDSLSDVIKRDDGWRLYANKLSATYASNPSTHTHIPTPLPSLHSGSKQGFLFGRQRHKPVLAFHIFGWCQPVDDIRALGGTEYKWGLRCSSEGRMSKGGRWAQRSALLCFVCEGKGATSCRRSASISTITNRTFSNINASLHAFSPPSLLETIAVKVRVHPFRHQVET